MATEFLNYTMKQSDLIDSFRILASPHRMTLFFFSDAHGIFSRTDHILEYKISLKNFERIEIISSIFSDHNDRRLEINHRKRNEKQIDYIGTKQHTTKKPNPSVMKSKREFKNILRKTIVKIQPYNIYGMQQKQLLRGSS